MANHSCFRTYRQVACLLPLPHKAQGLLLAILSCQAPLAVSNFHHLHVTEAELRTSRKVCMALHHDLPTRCAGHGPSMEDLKARLAKRLEVPDFLLSSSVPMIYDLPLLLITQVCHPGIWVHHVIGWKVCIHVLDLSGVYAYAGRACCMQYIFVNILDSNSDE